MTTVTDFQTTDGPISGEPLDRPGRTARPVGSDPDRGWNRSSSACRSVRLCVETDNRLCTLTVQADDVATTEGDGSRDRMSPLNQAVSLSGPLDLGTSAKVLNRLIDAIETGEGCLSVNLDRVSSITTTGVLVLDAAERHARRHHRQLVVVGAHRGVRAVIELVGLGRLVAGSEPARVA